MKETQIVKFLEKVPGLYGMGSLIDLDDHSHGYANINYRVKATGGQMFVRFCIEQTLENVRQEMLLMDLMKKHKIRTAYPMVTDNGEYIISNDDVPVVVYEFVEGSLPVTGSEVVAEIGREVGRLSAIPLPGGLVKQNAISIDAAHALLDGRLIGRVPPDIFEMFESLLSEVETTVSISLPPGIVHGDIFPDNTIFNGNKLAAIIDFEEFGIDTLLFDVGMTVNGFCFEGEKFREDLYILLIDSYNTERKLTLPELNCLPGYLAWAAIGMTCWHLYHLSAKRQGEQAGRMRELLGRARWILNERSYLDSLTEYLKA